MSDKEVLFITDAAGNKTHAVVPIETYKAFLALRQMIAPTAPVTEHEIYTLSLKGVTARGYPTGVRSRPDFVIIKGSQAVLATVDSLPEHIANFREELLGSETLKLDPEHNCFVFTKDLSFKSASFAAAVVSGNVRNGLEVWINREGFSLKESGYGVKKTGRH